MTKNKLKKIRPYVFEIDEIKVLKNLKQFLMPLNIDLFSECEDTCKALVALFKS